MIDKQNVGILDLLQHAEITDELYASLTMYTPSQHRSVYYWGSFATSFLNVIHNMVCVILFIYSYIRGLSAAVSFDRILAMTGKLITVC